MRTYLILVGQLLCFLYGAYVSIEIGYPLFTFASGMAWGALACSIFLRHFCKIERKHPYHWKCDEEGCNFQCSTNSEPMLVLNMAESHKRSFHADA